jgi:PAS domain S-box-containing protein
MDVQKRNTLENSLLSKLWQKSLDNMFILKVIDNDFYVVSTNDAQQEAVNIEDLEHFDKPLREVLPAELYNFVAPNYHRCIKHHTPIQYEESEVFTSGDGSIRHWSTMLSPISGDNDTVDYIFGISRNITELKNAKQAAEASAKLAEKANQVKTNFLANMSHEMRTPLNGIQCAIELLKEAQNEQERAELISIIESSTEALSRQTSDILQYAKIGKGKIALQEVDYSPFELIQSVVKIITNKAESKSLSINILINEQVPDLVRGDPDRVKQVLLNIVNNAIKFTHQGSISISLEFEKSKQLLKFCIIDTGIGIQESEQKKLFKPFSQVDDSSTRQFEGNGLGLVISKDLVLLMRGEINLSSRLGKGTQCEFTIPCETATRKIEVSIPKNINCFNDISILLVEDNPTNQIVLKKILHKAVSSITLANNGQQALELCQNHSFDIILMDWHMPIIDGLETTKTLRKHPVFSNTPILGLTASVMEEDLKACLDAGMNEVITKPINREELLSSITKYSKLISS